MTTLRRRLAAGALAAGVAITLTGCTGTEDDQYQPAPQAQEAEDFQPTSFGSDRLEECYFYQTPEEVVSLKEAGLCEDDWEPTMVSQDYVGDNDFFWAYLLYTSSPRYYERHVPASKRTTFAKSTDRLVKENPTKIAAAAPKATFRNSSGTTLTGDKVAPRLNGGGSRTTGGGGCRVVSLPKLELVSNEEELDILAKGGSYGGGGGGFRSSTPSVSRPAPAPAPAPRAPSSGGGSRSNTAPKSTNNAPKSNTRNVPAPTGKC